MIQGADAQVADPLTFGRLAPSSGPRCPNRVFNLSHWLYDNSEIDSIATLFRRVSYVGLDYTPKRQAHCNDIANVPTIAVIASDEH